MVIRNFIKLKDTIQSINLLTAVVKEVKKQCILLLLHSLRIEIEAIIQTRNQKGRTPLRWQKTSAKVEELKTILQTLYNLLGIWLIPV